MRYWGVLLLPASALDPDLKVAHVRFLPIPLNAKIPFQSQITGNQVFLWRTCSSILIILIYLVSLPSVFNATVRAWGGFGADRIDRIIFSSAFAESASDVLFLNDLRKIQWNSEIFVLIFWTYSKRSLTFFFK